ncbi:DinB family protein [Mongoliitalea daihaiensis]|uniref:DinB family protein n=1 Tax=Mongoliitalea daihaiensis TaxID=2782006 RepID=UPI001F2311C5|nr:DUF1572 family protein [Mongoliitalea daihaiensis]UJP64351.1 DUF1572 family protein [Mongoliitalea daihaiensis]
MKSSLLYFFDRDLQKVKNELICYKNEQNIWEIAPGISNSAGNLTMHIIGNLNHYIGNKMGDTGYERDRESEFSVKGIPREELLLMLDETNHMITDSILQFPEDWFSRDYPGGAVKEPMSYEYYMFHLVSHLNYHLGQINYHRRLLEK